MKSHVHMRTCAANKRHRHESGSAPSGGRKKSDWQSHVQKLRMSKYGEEKEKKKKKRKQIRKTKLSDGRKLEMDLSRSKCINETRWPIQSNRNSKGRKEKEKMLKHLVQPADSSYASFYCDIARQQGRRQFSTSLNDDATRMRANRHPFTLCADRESNGKQKGKKKEKRSCRTSNSDEILVAIVHSITNGTERTKRNLFEVN